MDSTSQSIVIRTADTPADYRVAAALIHDYAAELGVDLCFQDVAEELAQLAIRYGPPRGRLFIAWRGEAALGCVAIRELGEARAEMKRLYVSAAARGLGLGWFFG
jgi:GNAT superfamily N-acetyltransferase